MSRDKNKPDVMFLFGSSYEHMLTQSDKVHDAVQEFINVKRYRVADTPLTYRQVNSLGSNELLHDERESTSDWRKFSFKELVYLTVIKELRKFGIIDEQLNNLKTAFFSEKEKFGSDLALMAVLGKTKIILVFDEDSKIAFYTIPEFNLFEKQSAAFININFNEVVIKVLVKIGKERIDYKDELGLIYDLSKNNLNKKEEQILKLIRDKNYKTIIVRKNGDKSFIIKGEKAEIINEKELIKMIREKDFADISIIKRDGNIVNTKVEDNFKI